MVPSPRLIRIASVIAMAGVACTADVAPAAPTSPFEEIRAALTGGTANAYLRVRYENVRADNFEKGAHAGTMRLALGYETKPLLGVSLLAQYQGVYDLGNDLYNSTLNGHVDRPVISDPTPSVELHQAAVRYQAPDLPGLGLLIGRQEIIHGNQRFIGTAGWRQDWQAFDAETVSWKPKEGTFAGLDATYSFMSVFHRILPDTSPQGEVDLNGHAARVAYQAKPWLQPSAYTYLLDFKPTAAQTAFDNQSTATLGARLEGKIPLADDLTVVYTAEYAHQRDHGHNPLDISSSYRLGELGVDWKGFVAKAGYEVLTGDADTPGDKFTTPLATLHAFNGWADMFLSTPNAGLTDAYLSIAGPIPGAGFLKVSAAVHEFSAYDGDATYGHEYDLSLECPIKAFDPKLVVGAKLAIYRAGDDPGVVIPGSSTNVDTSKYWVYAQYAF